MKTKVLYPLATGLWLLRNTKLTKTQICEFCSITEPQLLSLDFENKVKPQNPVDLEQLSYSDIKSCEGNADKRLVSLIKIKEVKKKLSAEQRKYVPNVIAWFYRESLSRNIELNVKKLSKIIPVTKNKLNDIKINLSNYSSINPIMSGLCSKAEVDELLS